MKFSLALLIVFLSSISYSQTQLDGGRKQINLGVGNSTRGGGSTYAGLDYKLFKPFTLGPYAAFNDDLITGFAALNFHFDEIVEAPDRLNVYIGGNFGYRFLREEEEVDEGEFAGGLQLGARYFLSERLGVNFEFGRTNLLVNDKIGLTYTF